MKPRPKDTEFMHVLYSHNDINNDNNNTNTGVTNEFISTFSPWGCPRGVTVKAMNCGIVVRKFVLQSRYYVHFRANTIGKGMNPLILPPAMGK